MSISHDMRAGVGYLMRSLHKSYEQFGQVPPLLLGDYAAFMNDLADRVEKLERTIVPAQARGADCEALPSNVINLNKRRRATSKPTDGGAA